MKAMMECGHAANAVDDKGNPVCVMCIGILPGATTVLSTVPDQEPTKPTKTPELPACAAILYGGRTIPVIIAGKRHHDCLRSAEILGLRAKGLTQGFMTNKGRFVNRAEAYLLMQKEGIASMAEGGYRGVQLYSEDLY